VRTGKAKLQLRLLTFIGPDSVTAASVLEAAGLQNRLWNAADLMYHNQGEENSGYVTDAFLSKILTGAGAIDVKRALADASSSKVTEALGATKTLASRYNVQSTPTLLVGPTGGALKMDTEDSPTAAGVGKLVSEALAAKS
jgi:protein-disulfide isomerase